MQYPNQHSLLYRQIFNKLVKISIERILFLETRAEIITLWSFHEFRLKIAWAYGLRMFKIRYFLLLPRKIRKRKTRLPFKRYTGSCVSCFYQNYKPNSFANCWIMAIGNSVTICTLSILSPIFNNFFATSIIASSLAESKISNSCPRYAKYPS